jgi:hypothetical protein
VPRLAGQEPRQADLPRALADMQAVRAGVDLVWRETCRQENSGSRSRTLVAVLMAAMKALEVGEYEGRIQALEQAIAQNGAQQPWRGRAA